MRLFSAKNRPVHAGPFPTELLARRRIPAPASHVPEFRQLIFQHPDNPQSIVNAMRDHQAMLDAIRDGLINKQRAQCPNDAQERANHLKAFAYFSDAADVGCCQLHKAALLDTPMLNPDIQRLADDLKTRQTKTLASGIDTIMADLKESMQAPPTTIKNHTHALVFLYENPRQPFENESGISWFTDAYAHRAALLAAETAIVIANYLRLLGYQARAHTASSTDVNLNQLAISSGLATTENGALNHPYIGARFGLSAVSTSFVMATDLPLVPLSEQPRAAFGATWKLGTGSLRNATTAVPFAHRAFKDGVHPFETLKRVDKPTTYIDEPRVARVPKRTDMFARAQFGDLGKAVQAGAKGGHYVRKSAPSSAQRRALGAFVLLQDGKSAENKVRMSAKLAAENIKASSYFLGIDAVGISRCPDWTWYSHDAAGERLNPPHEHAISMIVDQGYETMEGASGDDWISVAQSMRAYLRFSLLGGVIAQQIRNLGYRAKAHSVLDGEVLQPPLLLLSGLGEVSRIGEVILNPFLGPRLKSGVVTTDLPMSHDLPIDFGLQQFCESCNKCARECPSGAITAGPKLMFNGYEIWKSDSQKCASYRITTKGGAMCGRCMKTCPWNLEGVFKEKPFRWAAMKLPKFAPVLASLDDAVGNGSLNPVKKWWWDLEICEDGAYRPTKNPINARALQKGLSIDYNDQTLAVYPANLAPHPYPYPYPMDREAGIKAYQAMLSSEEYRARLRSGKSDHIRHVYQAEGGSPVIQVIVSRVERMTDRIIRYQLQTADGSDLPAWQAGAHIDIVVAPEYLRQYSLTGNPCDRSQYEIAVLEEDNGRGGSLLLQRIFNEGRKIFISHPINHFALQEQATFTLLMGGGIGITPLIAMAHQLHTQGQDFQMHYSGKSRDRMAFMQDLSAVCWKHKVQLHVSNENTRCNLDSVMQNYSVGWHVYTCGADRYMSSVKESARRAGFPEDALHQEYFSVPEQEETVNHDFYLKLIKSNRTLLIPADRMATDVLQENGIDVTVKCSDGLCGVCQCQLVSGEVEHRDFVLSTRQRENSIILCQSRASSEGGLIEIDL